MDATFSPGGSVTVYFDVWSDDHPVDACVRVFASRGGTVYDKSVCGGFPSGIFDSVSAGVAPGVAGDFIVSAGADAPSYSNTEADTLTGAVVAPLQLTCTSVSLTV
jgi:hypothetical protein